MRAATLAALIASSAAAPNLHVAAYKDDVNVIKDQLALGVDVNLKSEEGDRALHVAVAKGSVNGTSSLLGQLCRRICSAYEWPAPSRYSRNANFFW